MTAECRVQRLFLFATIFASALFIACAAWSLAQAFVRPPDYAEGCVLFNSSRIRDGLALYTDLAAGAHEYGEPPSRYLVAYTPFHAALASLLPAGLALGVARLVGLAAWWGALAVPVFYATGERKRSSRALALFLGGTFLFARWGATAKPDAVALLFLSCALVRVGGKGRLDAWSGALLAIAALWKPSVVGAAPGLFVASALGSWRGRDASEREERSGALWATSAVVAVSVIAFGGLALASHGEARRHLLAALGLSFQWHLFVENNLSRLPFVFGLFLAASVVAYRSRRDGGGARLLFSALLTSVTVAALGLGKIGSASNYLMEPALVSLAIVAKYGFPRVEANARSLVIGAALAASASWTAVATMRSLRDEARGWGELTSALESVKHRCRGRESDFALSDNPGFELALNGRIYTHPLELYYLALSGRFSSAAWAADVTHPNVRCFVSEVSGSLPPAPEGPFPPEVAEALAGAFDAPTRIGPLVVYLRKSPRASEK